MNRRILGFQLAIFATIGAAALIYTSFSILGVSIGNRNYTVTVELATAGGVFQGSDVSYRGVRVGKVSAIKITRSGVDLRLTLNNGFAIPANATANVHDLSVAGEQYVDLVAAHDTRGHLHDGSIIPASRTTTPTQFANVLFDLQQWIRGFHPGDLTILSRELGTAFVGTGPEMRQILASSSTLLSQLSAAQPEFLDLLDNSNALLTTAANHAQDLATFSRSLRALSTTLRTSTPAITRLLDESAGSAQLIDAIIRDNGSSAAVLMGNLATFSGIQVAHVPGLKSLLIAIPELGQNLPQIIRDGKLQAAALFDYGSPVCTTGVPLTSPISGMQTAVKAAKCLRGGGPSSVPNLLMGATSARQTSSGAAQVGGFDPSGTAVTEDGAPVTLGWNGGQEAVLGDRAWQSLLDPTFGGAS